MGRVVANLSNLDRLQKTIKESEGLNLQVGWFSSAKYDDGTPVAGIMALQEYGSPRNSIPPRPFFRPAVQSNRKDWNKLVEKGLKSVINGTSKASDVMNGLGLKVQSDIKNEITNGDHAALSPVTLAIRKLRDDGYQIGGSLVGAVAGAISDGKTGPGELGEPSANRDPLRDTGLALATLTYEVN